MTVSLCIRQGSKRNDDSVSVEELDWSNPSLPDEHLWCNFKWAKHSSPNTNDLYIHYMDESTGTPSLEENKALPNCGNKDGNIFHVLKNSISTSVASVLKCMKWLYLYVISVWWWVFGTFKVTPEVFIWETGIRPVKFFHTDWIIISLWFLSYTQRHCHVRIEKSSVQTVAIKLEAHNSLEYHYMLKH